MAKTEDKAYVDFLFTEDGFILDTTSFMALDDEGKERFLTYEKDRFTALYEYTLTKKEGEIFSPSETYLQLVADSFFKNLRALSELELLRDQVVVTMTDYERDGLLDRLPFVPGASYVDASWLMKLYDDLKLVFDREIKAYKGSVRQYFTEKNSMIQMPERIFFHLVENRKDEEYPFAFAATYAAKTEEGKVKHVALRYALTEFKGDREKLVSFLACLNKAAEVSSLIAEFMERGELFHTLRLTNREAYQFLKDIEAIESVGILCRIPNWWRSRSSSVSLSVRLGEKKESLLGLNSLLKTSPALMVDGVPLSKEEIKSLLAQTEGLALIKGKWVEVDHEKLRKLLDQMKHVPKSMSLLDALRSEILPQGEDDVYGRVTNGAFLQSILSELRNPASKKEAFAVPGSFTAKLRPYQIHGYGWLMSMSQLGLGACIADDMGLGKTIQVLAYLENLRGNHPDAEALLIVPASLLGNWEKEIRKFAPSMDYRLLYGKPSTKLCVDLVEERAFLTITTYGMAAKISALADRSWDVLILDEAQAIKNPGTKQTKELKKIPAGMRIAMTGTPIENDLTNLWSLFDFLDQGLLGSSKEFASFCKGISSDPTGYQHLKTMISPFLLRRLKTDKSIISDLPDKFEVVDHVALSKKQKVLYKQVVDELAKSIGEKEGMERRGMVLSTISKLKQICNHPSQYLGDGDFSAKDSGKYELLAEICQTIYEKRERVLVFTQFREITEELSAYLSEIFHAEGLVLHGGVSVKERNALVERFQGEAYVPFMILSVKAGGTGLNLTKANHVIHFDRWWNPAVENQATDRAFRIGQTKNVLVHKLVSEGTIEEKIDEMILSKKELAESVIGDSASEKWITELSDKELLDMLKLR